MTSCGTLWGISVKSVLTEMTSACHWVVGKAGPKYQRDLDQILPTDNTVKKFKLNPHNNWPYGSSCLADGVCYPQSASPICKDTEQSFARVQFADLTVSKSVSDLIIQDKRETLNCIVSSFSHPVTTDSHKCTLLSLPACLGENKCCW